MAASYGAAEGEDQEAVLGRYLAGLYQVGHAAEQGARLAAAGDANERAVGGEGRVDEGELLIIPVLCHRHTYTGASP